MIYINNVLSYAIVIDSTDKRFGKFSDLCEICSLFKKLFVLSLLYWENVVICVYLAIESMISNSDSRIELKVFFR